MSLFGSSPDGSSTLADQHEQSEPKSLFSDHQTPGTGANPSLFDDDGGNGPSPWDLPTPKKAGRRDIVKTLLPTSDVPESYIDLFDILAESGHRTGAGSIDLSGIKKLYEGSGVEEGEQRRILNLVTGGQSPEKGLSRNEFNVLLALTALSQLNEEATLDGVDERRKGNEQFEVFEALPKSAYC